MGKYTDTCWECEYLASSTDWRNPDVNGSRREIRCNELHYNVNPYDKKCYRFRDGHYNDDFIQRCVDAFNKKCNYYIVSACVGISNPANGSELLDAFKEMSTEGINAEEVVCALHSLGITPENLLEEYEVYGKAIADSLYACYANPESKDVTKAYVDSEVIPKLNTLKSRLDGGRKTGAVIGYVCLTRSLMNKLGITYIKPEDKKEEITEPTVDTPAFGTR